MAFGDALTPVMGNAGLAATTSDALACSQPVIADRPHGLVPTNSVADTFVPASAPSENAEFFTQRSEDVSLSEHIVELRSRYGLSFVGRDPSSQRIIDKWEAALDIVMANLGFEIQIPSPPAATWPAEFSSDLRDRITA